MHRLELAAPRPEVVQRPLLAIVRGGVPADDRYDAVTVFERQGGVDKVVRDREGRRGDRNAAGHTDDADACEPGIADEHPDSQPQVDPRHSCSHVRVPRALAQPFGAEARGKCGGLAPVPPGRAQPAVARAPMVKHLFEVPRHVVLDVGWQRGVEQDARDSWRSPRAAAHFTLRSLGSRPRHMLSSAWRDARRLSAPASVSWTQRRAFPPRSGVGSLMVDESSPFCSSLRSVT